MAKIKNTASSSSKPVKKKSPQNKKPAPKVFQVISDVRSNIIPELFEGITKSFPMETSEPKKVVRTKRTKKAMFEVAVVGEEEVPTDGTVDGTQESVVVASKSKSKPKAKPKKKDVISPAVGENEVDVEAEDGEGSQSDKATEEETQTMDAGVQVVGEELQVRKRRHLRKATSIQVAEVEDNKKVSPVDLGTEPVVSGIPTIEELDQYVNELLARLFVVEVVQEEEIDRDDKDLQGQRDGREKTVPVFPQEVKCSLRPYGKELHERYDGCANHATIKSLRNLPLKHKCAILCINMDETSLLTGDILYASVRTDDRRCRKIDRLMGEKYALEREVKELKLECDNAFEISSQLKADMDMVMDENQTLENENRELKATSEGEKDKKQSLEEKELLIDDDELIPEIEKKKINPNLKYEKEPIPSIEGEPSVWSEAYEADPMKFIKECGIEADVYMDIPCPVKVVRPTPPITAPQAPSTSVPSQNPTVHPSPLSDQSIRPPHPNASSENVL
ncbi:hypothetical protein Dimus_010795 [Dionaea muscipula]